MTAHGGTATDVATAQGVLPPILRLAAVIALLHVAGLLLLFHPSWSAGSTTAVGLGLTAYILGLRHAIDADHIAAIDNTTRKLVGDGRSPVSVGFWFSLGHSTVVLGLTLALSLGASEFIAPMIEDDASTLHEATGIVGATVSGVFLYLIAGINVVILFSLVVQARAVMTGRISAEKADQVKLGGPLIRLFDRVAHTIRRPWHMYPIGVLFGFGFDTATEIGLLVIAATSAAAGTPWYVLLALPLLFAAAMSLLDTADGIMMRFAYGWAFGEPGRRMQYNIVVTGISAVVAIAVGSLALRNAMGERFPNGEDVWAWAGSIDSSTAGMIIAALLIAAWASALIASGVKRSRRGTAAIRS